MITTTLHVEGMSCGHCVGAIEAELCKVSGVSAVAVDLASGQVDITSASPLDLEIVRAAVETAGYAVAS